MVAGVVVNRFFKRGYDFSILNDGVAFASIPGAQ